MGVGEVLLLRDLLGLLSKMLCFLRLNSLFLSEYFINFIEANRKI